MTTSSCSRPGPPASGRLRLLLALSAFAVLLAAPSSLAASPTAAAPLFLGPAASAPPVLVFEPEAVVAGGFAPGEEVIVHGVSRHRVGYVWRLVQTREVVVADAAGDARLELSEGIAPRSLWTAASAATGEFHIGSPEGFTPTEHPFPGNGIDRAQNGAWRRLRNRFERAEVLYLRPGVGGWWLLGTRGAESDRGRGQGPDLALELDQGRPLWGSEPPPEEFAAGDVVVTVNLDTLDFFAARLVSPGGPH
ncbi:MAG TPA: hypothetical protein VLF66_03015 [Thermoanaerobaculia bacterium]|nr:hypothetical protein [Thermoanaerobaculia bacterium]